MIRFRPLPGLLLGILAVLGCGPAWAGYTPARRASVPGEARWDVPVVDPIARRFYLPHGDRVEVLDPTSLEKVGEVRPVPGATGVATVLEDTRGFVAEGADSAVTVFDLNTYRPLARVPVGSRPAALAYDPGSRRVFVLSGGSGGLSSFAADADLMALEAKGPRPIPLGGRPVSAIADGKDRLYIALEDSNQIVVVDTKKLTVTARWPVAPGEHPTRLAVDAEGGLVFAACGNGRLIVLESGSGRVRAALTPGADPGNPVWDAEWKRLLCANGEGTVSIFAPEADGSFKPVGAFETERGARLLALDAKTHRIFAITATFAPPTSGGAEGSPGSRVPVRGSVRVLAFDSARP